MISKRERRRGLTRARHCTLAPPLADGLSHRIGPGRPLGSVGISSVKGEVGLVEPTNDVTVIDQALPPPLHVVFRLIRFP
ncbi:MAG: hypothetical protein HW375_2018, partial [Anaerolineales bacterium]|nr:hypothetical protein [Anaerolineales bacterium]